MYMCVCTYIHRKIYFPFVNHQFCLFHYESIKIFSYFDLFNKNRRFADIPERKQQREYPPKHFLLLNLISKRKKNKFKYLNDVYFEFI